MHGRHKEYPSDITEGKRPHFIMPAYQRNAPQWSGMKPRILKLVHELEPAKLRLLVDGKDYLASAFCSKETSGQLKIVDGIHAKTTSSTVEKNEL